MPVDLSRLFWIPANMGIVDGVSQCYLTPLVLGPLKDAAESITCPSNLR